MVGDVVTIEEFAALDYAARNQLFMEWMAARDPAEEYTVYNWPGEPCPMMRFAKDTFGRTDLGVGLTGISELKHDGQLNFIPAGAFGDCLLPNKTYGAALEALKNLPVPR